jgi:streptogramin lyase
MEFKRSSNRFRSRYALIVLLLLFTFIPFALSGCGSGGGSSSSTTPSISPTSAIQGTVYGGDSPVGSGTVQLYECPKTATPCNNPVAVGNPVNINSGSYNIPYTPQSGYNYYVKATNGDINLDGIVPVSNSGVSVANINEYTTMVTQYAKYNSNNQLPFSSFEELVNTSSTNTSVNGNGWPITPQGINSTLATAQPYLATFANALQNCVSSAVAAGSNNLSTASCTTLMGYITTTVGSASPTTISEISQDIFTAFENNSSVSIATQNSLQSDLVSLANTSTSVVFNINGNSTNGATSILQQSDPLMPEVTSGTSSVSTNVYTAEDAPISVAIDGNGNIWITNFGGQCSWSSGCISDAGGTGPGDSNVIELNGTTGAVMGTYTVGSGPEAIAIDGNNNIWVANYSSNNVTELNGTTGAVVGTYNVGIEPRGIAIAPNGNVWVANSDNGTNGVNSSVTELNGSTGAVMGTYSTGDFPRAVAIDSNGNVWIVNYGNGTSGTAAGDSSVTELNGSTGAVMGTYATGPYPYTIAIDKNDNIWIVNHGNSTITELNGSNGALIATYPVSSNTSSDSRSIAIDSNGNIWIASNGDNSITELNGTTGAVVGTYNTSNPYDIAIDKSGDIWVATGAIGTIDELIGAV